MTTSNSTTDDNLLLAVRYVLNECNPSELAGFELRLGDDPAAQEALVQAVQIVALLQATPTCEELESSLQVDSASRKPAAPVRRSWQVASLVAASLLASVALFWPSPPEPQDNHTATLAMTTESPVLAQVWTSLDPQHFTTDDTVEAQSAPEDALEEAVEIADDVPDWLLTAVLVEEEQGQPDDNDMGLEEETQL